MILFHELFLGLDNYRNYRMHIYYIVHVNWYT